MRKAMWSVIIILLVASAAAGIVVLRKRSALREQAAEKAQAARVNEEQREMFSAMAMKSAQDAEAVLEEIDASDALFAGADNRARQSIGQLKLDAMTKEGLKNGSRLEGAEEMEHYISMLRICRDSHRFHSLYMSCLKNSEGMWQRGLKGLFPESPSAQQLEANP